MTEEKEVWVIDIETLRNAFVVCAFNGVDKKEFVIFQHYDDQIDDQEELIKFMNECEVMCGFNSIGFDYPVLMHAYEMRYSNPKQKLISIYRAAQNIIESRHRQSRSKLIKQIDLFKLHHFDNKGKMVSLKALQVWMNWHNVQEMPISHEMIITKDQLPEIIDYCWNDVLSTYDFYIKSKDKVEEREKMGYPNIPDANVGEKILLKAICKKSGLSEKEVLQMRTWRKEIEFNKIILPNIEFKTKGFQKLLDYMKGIVLPVVDGGIKTEGKMNMIDRAKVLDMMPFMNTTLKKGKIEKLSIIHKGFQYDFGAGGIHGSIKPGRYYAEDDTIIMDYDVASFYPALPVQYGFAIEHLKDYGFIETYAEIFYKRLEYKKKKNKIKAEELKLALNGAYGKSNSKYSFLYDPQYTMETTINGQLLLAMLAEELAEHAQILQINTDGVTIRAKRKVMYLIDEILKQWELKSRMTLESVEYKVMIIRDVNNYIAVKTDGEIKRKGEFEIIREPHKDPSFRIIPTALSAYFVGGVPIDVTFQQNKDLFLYFGRYKGNTAWKAQSHQISYKQNHAYEHIEQHGKTVRYIPVKSGVRLYKTNGTSLIAVHADTDVLIWNKAVEVPFESINLDFFHKRCRDIINLIDTPQVSLL
jgi:hypothetical protein